MTASRAQQKESTRRAILDAAIRLFAQGGYDGTNFREITAACGAQRSLILYHFTSKEKLWQSAAEAVECRFNEAFEVNFEPERQGTDEARVRHTLSCFLDALHAVPEYGRIYLREGTSEGPRMEWLARHFAPRRALALNLDDPALEARVKTTILRDILASVLVSFVTLAPLLDRSHANASRRSTAGLSPLDDRRREEFIDHLIRLIFS